MEDQKIWVTSDHHFFHANIIKHCKRPYDNYEDMNKDMIKLWNERIKKDDIVLYLGDLSACVKPLVDKSKRKTLKSIVDQLNGKLYLIKGNHDNFSDKTYRNCGFTFIGDYLIKQILGKNILFIHVPAIIDEYTGPAHQRTKKIIKEHNIDYVIHGHRHISNPDGFPTHFNVAVDLHDFKPLELGYIMKELKNKNI